MSMTRNLYCSLDPRVKLDVIKLFGTEDRRPLPNEVVDRKLVEDPPLLSSTTQFLFEMIVSLFHCFLP